jgi:hypothetical protein
MFCRYSELGPQVFNVGDLVEVQVSFIVVPLKGQNYKVLNVMHAIALLDSQFSKVRCSIQRIQFSGY